MGSHKAGHLRRVTRVTFAAIVSVAGALVGLIVGVVSSIILSAGLGSSDGADEPFILGIVAVLAIVVPIAMLAGGALAVRLYRQRT